MRRILGAAVVSAIVLSVSSVVEAQTHNGQIGGFGGLTFGDTAASSTFGGSVTIGISDNLQIIGEGGRLRDVKPSLLGTVLDLSPVDLRIAAWYGEGGVRLIASPHSAVRPYAEATAGFARIKTAFDGLGGMPGVVLDAALRFLDRTEPMLGVGGGVSLQGGPVVLDVGYRYKKIMADGPIDTLLTGRDGFEVSQARVGIGLRF
jgi:opacity protein-like surface antigen